MVEVDICLIPAHFPLIIQVWLVDCWVSMFMVTMEVEIGLIPTTFLYITMVDNTLSTKGSFKNLFQGGGEEKISKIVIKGVSYIHIRNILIIRIQAWHHNLIQAWNHTLIQEWHHNLFFVSILHFFSYLCTICSFTPSAYWILRKFILSTDQYYYLLHVTKPTSCLFAY